MKIAIHNTFYGGKLAEAELSRRLILAANNIGWDALEVGSSDEIWRYQPDFVLSLHFKTPKLTCFPTYGCLWHPTVLIETNEQFTRNILSYDAFLTSSPHVDRWLGDRVYNTPKKYFIAPFFTSCNRTEYQQPDLQSPRLMYVGSNWDGERFKKLFCSLDSQPWLDVYGSESGWSYLNRSYRGTLPFDGISVLKALNQAGVGLCLHRDEHTREGIPSMRIFEITASGAIAICGAHPFIRQHFADTVLYIDSYLSTADQVTQITDHLNWIATHSQMALEMSKAAHQIFVDQFSLEQLLLNLQSQHQNLLAEKGFAHGDLVKQTSSVQLILKISNRDLIKLKRSLESIEQQTYQNRSVLLIKDVETTDELNSLLGTYQSSFPIQIIDCKPSHLSSHYLWCGLQAISADYFGVLESGAIIYPNHLYTLVSLLDSFKEFGIAYSEVIQPRIENSSTTPVDPYDVIDPKILSSLPSDIADLLPFHSGVNINGFLARSSLIDTWLKHDPQLEMFDDIFLLLNLAARGRVMSSYEATCEIDITPPGYDRVQRVETLRRIELMMSDREFSTGQSTTNIKRLCQQLYQSQTELAHTQARIRAMESSKFWQFRKQWFQLKRRLGLNTDNE